MGSIKIELPKKISVNKEITKKYITENFAPVGENDKLEHVTSADIVRDMSEMAYVTTTEVSELMNNAKFKVVFICGKPYWAVYRR